MSKTIQNLFYLFLPTLVGLVIGLLTSNSIDYSSLQKPPFAPPSILFPIVWSILYLCMGISYFLLKKEKVGEEVDKIYYSQLIANALWSIIFFLLKWRFLACIWIILLDILIIRMLRIFKKENKISYYLNLPYFIWCLFATYLTIGIYLLN